MATSFRPYKLTTLVRRRSDITEQEFHKYWSEKHPIVVNDWLARHGVVKYVQYHTPSELRDQCEFGQGSSQIAEFDGYVELTVPNIEALKRAFDDPFYKSHVAPDEAVFIDAQGTRRTFGYEEVYIKDGEVKN
ncbi:hypothetical protein D6C89_08222 [Aureobasidium pullulans]|uniref:EthD domain-containing protein n=1 Tax=Aureobasidium pullulans TaxID=5580 RepID=A0A4S8VVC3_AURPU|nr:hypothetical protein D6D24_04990 [Aureobasidium pullulans]THW38269.1 hypothetical protein D6D21_07877 [Aureobasidium pullulans]THX57597.1 hypothetical protein D6D11_03136 [Aureobasidium pullulans]THZ18536.1 hypothetical protein D6C89_08222 [Aureobasidium pullulans]TIA40066.1 hypothetical protein D6C79_07517 [Aureobasidium pullulans]